MSPEVGTSQDVEHCASASVRAGDGVPVVLTGLYLLLLGLTSQDIVAEKSFHLFACCWVPVRLLALRSGLRSVAVWPRTGGAQGSGGSLHL